MSNIRSPISKIPNAYHFQGSKYVKNIMGGKTSGEQGLVLLVMASDPAITLAPTLAKKTYHPVHHSQPMNELF